ncbi:MAG: divalent metal cation transporter [Chloroflexi bacterium]|nr:divalent metal cation transporter [Chloroflexota bacterium]
MAEAARRAGEPGEREPAGGLRRLLRVAGPGIITGGAENDPAGVTTYATVGATTGTSQLWLLLLATPLLIVVQALSARLGSVTKLGFAELIRNEFGRPIAIGVSVLVVAANVTTIGADLVAMAAVLQLLTHVRLTLFIVPLVVVLGYITIFMDYKKVQRLMLWVILAFVSYIAAAVLSHPDWGHVLTQTVVPPIELNVTYFVGAVGLLGTTIQAYLFYFQAEGEREERRGTGRMGETYLDVASGMITSNLVAYFIIVSTASTLFVHNRSIQTAADAAKALSPFAGQFATVLFSVGILGAGTLGVPVLAVSTGYIVAGTLGWREGLGRQAYRAPGFYSVIALSLLVGVELANSGINPVKALFYSQVLSGIITPPHLILLMLLVSRRRVMGAFVASRWERVVGWLAVLVMTLSILALAYTVAGG